MLLTGAGFTRSFGGYLADQMWAAIFNQPEIDKYPSLRECLLRNINFEDAYESVVSNSLEGHRFSPEERQAFTDALGRAYDQMDGQIQNCAPVAMAACDNFLNLFAGVKTDERGFIFTLNQDMLVERFFPTRGMQSQFWIDMPGLDCSLWFRNKPPRVDDCIDYLFSSTGEQQINAQLSYIKLHGSDNWFSSKLGLVRVIGRQKSHIIENEPLLTWYHSLFAEVLKSCKNLVVIGYSFKDPHINSPVIAAIQNGLKLYVISPLLPGDFCASLQNVHGKTSQKDFDPNSHLIWTGLAGYFQGTVKDFISGKQKIGQAAIAFLQKLSL